MRFYVEPTKEALGEKAAQIIANTIRDAINKKGYARIVLSTGASQFDTLQALTNMDVDWSKVTMFHLDEYVALPDSHIASFRKYLKERFVSKARNLKEAVFVNGEGDIKANIEYLTKRLREDTIDIGVIGIGENCHIAFNDPPADFNTKEAYIVVNLDDACKRQQVGEGWFEKPEDVPSQAISMTPYQIMQCQVIVSPVPYAVKAQCIRKVLEAKDTNPMIPATLLKTHPHFYLFADKDSASECSADLLAEYNVEEA